MRRGRHPESGLFLERISPYAIRPVIAAMCQHFLGDEAAQLHAGLGGRIARATSRYLRSATSKRWRSWFRLRFSHWDLFVHIKSCDDGCKTSSARIGCEDNTEMDDFDDCSGCTDSPLAAQQRACYAASGK